MYYTRLYNNAYCKIGAKTPISADCGALCGARCCHGDENAGMIVFPGEEKALIAHGFNLTQRDMNGYPIYFATCTGKCKRIFRPLACRIFPLVPDFRDGVLTIREDPRAMAICPLLQAQAVEPEFSHAVYSAFEILLEDPEICKMLTHYTAMLDEYRAFWNK